MILQQLGSCWHISVYQDDEAKLLAGETISIKPKCLEGRTLELSFKKLKQGVIELEKSNEYKVAVDVDAWAKYRSRVIELIATRGVMEKQDFGFDRLNVNYEDCDGKNIGKEFNL
jgi:hypothetical protein